MFACKCINFTTGFVFTSFMQSWLLFVLIMLFSCLHAIIEIILINFPFFLSLSLSYPLLSLSLHSHFTLPLLSILVLFSFFPSFFISFFFLFSSPPFFISLLLLSLSLFLSVSLCLSVSLSLSHSLSVSLSLSLIGYSFLHILFTHVGRIVIVCLHVT